MAVTILEALQNAQINLVTQRIEDAPTIIGIGAVQLNNAIVLLEKGYSPSDEVEPLLGKYGNVEKVPEKKLNVSGAEQKLILDTSIKERSLIVYVIESSLEDSADIFSEDYKMALKDEITNHNLCIQEYNEQLKNLKING
jgi:hypothetical protein